MMKRLLSLFVIAQVVSGCCVSRLYTGTLVGKANQEEVEPAQRYRILHVNYDEIALKNAPLWCWYYTEKQLIADIQHCSPNLFSEEATALPIELNVSLSLGMDSKSWNAYVPFLSLLPVYTTREYTINVEVVGKDERRIGRVCKAIFTEEEIQSGLALIPITNFDSHTRYCAQEQQITTGNSVFENKPARSVLAKTIALAAASGLL